MYKSLAFTVLIFLSVKNAHAVYSELSYSDCEKILLEKNKDIQVAKLKFNQSEHELKSVYSNFLPELSVSSSFSDSQVTNENPSKKIYSSSIDLTQNIFSGFQDYLKIQTTKFDLEKSNIQLSQEKMNQIFELKNAFLSMGLAQKLYSFAQKNIKTRQNIKDLVSLKFSSGSETKDSLLFSEGELDEAYLDLVSAQNALSAARRKLSFILGEELSDEFSAVGNIPKNQIPESPNFREMSINSLEFKNANLNEKISNDEKRISQAKFLPTVDFTVSREKENKRSYSETAFVRNYYTVFKLVINLPLFDGFSSYHDLKKSELEQQKASLTSVKVYEEQLSQLKTCYEKNIELSMRRKIYAKYLEAAKLREEINTSKYRLGLIHFDTWIDSQNELINYEKNVIEIDFEIDSNLSKWESLAEARN